ncbi:Hpt domain-containing protein [Sphingomonas sp. MMS24-J13]|uniref:Hpt domain-containing protein n=1 Tax=Sphingomonas sp. MMS24-J13 TaxID=3238686 RepID=UPI00384A6F2D
MSDAIDRARLGALRRELGNSFMRILGYFREDGVRSIDAIEDAVRQRSAVALVRPAHTLKGEALQFGALPLGLMAEKIEMAARRAVEDRVFPIDVIEYVVQLRPLFEEALRVLTRETAAISPIGRAMGFGRKIAAGF